jgi:putative transposase
MIKSTEDHKDDFGTELICGHLAVAPQSYSAAKTKAPSSQSITDDGLTTRMHEIHTSNYGVYGVRKV